MGSKGLFNALNLDEDEVASWSVQDVCDWLISKDASNTVQHFSKHKIDGVSLLLLNENDLKNELGLRLLGDVKRIYSEILKLRLKNQESEVLKLPYSFVNSSSNTSSVYDPSQFYQNIRSTSTTLCPPKTVAKRNRTYSSDSQTDFIECSYTASTNLKNNAGLFNYRKPNQETKNLPPEYFRTVVSCVYMFTVTWVTAIVMVYVHDRVPDKERHPPLPDIFLDNVPHISWAFQLCEITILILITTWVVILFFHKHRSILLRRFAALSGSVFLLRCATMFITSLSVPGHHQECSPRDQSDVWLKLQQASVIWTGGGLSIKGVRTCGDYMFSGHTTALTILNFFITEYTPRRMYFLHIVSWVLNTFGIFFILAAHEHYSIDVFIAFYITSRMFLYYHSLANNRALQQRDSFRTKIWFPMFSYFEAHIDGIVPNEYSNPMSRKNVIWFCRKAISFGKKFFVGFLAGITTSNSSSPISSKKKM